MVNVIHGDSTGVQCLTGQVVLLPQQGIGATIAFLITSGNPIRLRQVPGPNNQGVPLSSVGGRQATVCGNFLVDSGQVLMNVTVVRPLLQ